MNEVKEKIKKYGDKYREIEHVNRQKWNILENKDQYIEQLWHQIDQMIKEPIASHERIIERAANNEDH